LALRVGLTTRVGEIGQIGLAGLSFANTVADTDYLGFVVVYCIHKRSERARAAIVTVVRAFYVVDDRGIRSSRTGPFDVEIGLVNVGGHDTRVAPLDLNRQVQGREPSEIAEGHDVILVVVIAVGGEVGLANDADGLTGAVEAGRGYASAGHSIGIRRQVVDSREIAGSEEVVARYRRSNPRLRLDAPGMRRKIVQPGHTCDHSGKGVGDGNVVRGGKMRLATDHVIVNGRVEGSFDLSGGPVERNPIAAAGNLVDGEALRGEPGGKSGDIGLSDAEAVGEFFGSEPLVIVGRAGVLLLDKQLV
jgi:hypothetical protein